MSFIIERLLYESGVWLPLVIPFEELRTPPWLYLTDSIETAEKSKDFYEKQALYYKIRIRDTEKKYPTE